MWMKRALALTSLVIALSVSTISTAFAATAVADIYWEPDWTKAAVLWWNDTAGYGGNFVLRDVKCDGMGAYAQWNVNGGAVRTFRLGSGCDTEYSWGVSGSGDIRFRVCLDRSLAYDPCSHWVYSKI